MAESTTLLFADLKKASIFGTSCVL